MRRISMLHVETLNRKTSKKVKKMKKKKVKLRKKNKSGRKKIGIRKNQSFRKFSLKYNEIKQNKRNMSFFSRKIPRTRKNRHLLAVITRGNSHFRLFTAGK